MDDLRDVAAITRMTRRVSGCYAVDVGYGRRILGFIGLAAVLGSAGPGAARSPEAATAARFDAVVGQPAQLRMFLQAMPKGGDLHNHLWGGPYAEDWLGWAADDGLCIDRAALTIAPPPCRDPDRPPTADLGSRDPALRSAMIDAMSMRGHDAGRGLIAGHDRFFNSFDRFAAVAGHSTARMLASARASAARNTLIYLELMTNPAASATLGTIAGAGPWNPTDLAATMHRLEPAIPPLIAAARAETDRAEAEARTLLGCDRASAAPPACAVEVRYQAFGLRQLPPAIVFGQLALGFALVEADPRYVGVNLVAPEDGAVALADYDLHMRMFAFFAARYPTVPVSLHAGELVLGLVPPAELDSHIGDAVAVARARRIGHGVSIAHEADADMVLARMARERIAVEINLTSNDAILGVRGPAHPLGAYRAAGVPVVLSTDDEGVSRTDMTNEYLRAATEQGLRYTDLKAIARASIDHAFAPGEIKAALRQRLDRQFRAFEARVAP